MQCNTGRGMAAPITAQQRPLGQPDGQRRFQSFTAAIPSSTPAGRMPRSEVWLTVNSGTQSRASGTGKGPACQEASQHKTISNWPSPWCPCCATHTGWLRLAQVGSGSAHLQVVQAVFRPLQPLPSSPEVSLTGHSSRRRHDRSSSTQRQVSCSH
jgi:hypothetical protein